jgi:hypothetical protein
MNDSADEDRKLLNFLRQHRSILPPEPTESEDRLMSEIDLLPTEPRSRVSWRWRYLCAGIGMIAAGVAGVTMSQMINPPEPSLAELQQLNLYLEAHAHSLNDNLEQGLEDRSNRSDVDLDILIDNDHDDVEDS